MSWKVRRGKKWLTVCMISQSRPFPKTGLDDNDLKGVHCKAWIKRDKFCAGSMISQSILFPKMRPDDNDLKDMNSNKGL